MSGEILVVRCGTVPYEEARELQRQLEARRQRDEIGDVLLLLEHPPVYTRGRRSKPEELPMGAAWYEAQGIEVVDTDRGGLVTYHGPGQLVAYPIVQLAGYGDDVHEYVRGLERTTIDALGAYGVRARTIEGLTGVWADRRRDDKSLPAGHVGPSAPRSGQSGPSTPGAARKIGSIGLHVSRGVTTHGLAVNVNNDLQPFEWVVPCGIEGVSMTSLSRELGTEQDLGAFAEALVGSYASVFARRPVPAALGDLGVRAPSATLR
jgi:lipoyl(octanoyl) transferase